MAITYQPPEAFDASVSQAYGALQQQNLRSEYQLKVAEARAAAAARDQANANQVSGQNAQVNIDEANNQLKSGVASAQNQTSIEEAGMREQGQMQRQANEFNYADNLRLQNLQQQRSMIANDPTLGDDERASLRSMMDPSISALTFRQKQTQIQQERAQTDRIQHQTAQMTTMQGLNDQFRARMLPNATVQHRDDEGNLIAITHPDGRGGFHTIQIRQQNPTGNSASETRPLTAAQTAGFRRSAETSVARDPAFIGKPQPEIDREVEARFRRWTRQQGASETLPPRPIELPDNAPLSRLPADQRGILRGLNADQAVLTGANSRLTADEKTEVNTDIARFRELFRQFGQVASMPPLEKSEFLAIARRLDELTGRSRAGAPRQTAPQAGPGSAPANVAPPESSADVPI